MHWLLKAAIGRVLTHAPRGDRVHEWVQRNVTRTLPSSPEQLRVRLAWVGRYVDAFNVHQGVPIEEARFGEIGAGRDLIVPLGLAALGVGEQHLYDVTPLARPDLVEVSRAFVAKETSPVGGRAGLFERPVDAAGLEAWLSPLGISYHAPRRIEDAAERGFDCVTSTFTLEHVPSRALSSIFTAVRRRLVPGGLWVSVVDLADHYSFGDPRISPYNYLRFGVTTWRFMDNRFLHQNRWRYPAYLRALEAAGFVLEHVSTEAHPEGERFDFRRVHHEFSRYTPEELAVTELYFVARRT